MSKDFVKPVGIAVVLAGPLAWYAMSHWLKEFSYKVDLEWRIFCLAAAASLLIRAVLNNPVESLHTE